MMRLICVYLLFSLPVMSLTSDEYVGGLISKAESGSSLSGADRAALRIYYKFRGENGASEAFAKRYAAHTYNYFRGRDRSPNELRADSQASLEVLLNRNPQLVARNEKRGLRKVQEEADVASKASLLNQCQKTKSGPCDLLDEREEKILMRLKRVKSIKDAIAHGPQRAIDATKRSVQNATEKVVNKVRQLGEKTSHVIQCEVSPPSYNSCVTADGVTYVRSGNQAISNIREHVKRSRGSRGSFNEQKRKVSGQ